MRPTPNPFAENISKLIDFLIENEIVADQAEIAQKLGRSTATLSRTKNITYDVIKTAEKVEAEIKNHYGLTFDSDGKVEQLVPIQVPSVDEPKTDFPPMFQGFKAWVVQRTTLYVLAMCLLINGLMFTCNRLIGTDLENSIVKVDKKGIYFDKPLLVNKQGTTVSFFGDRDSTRVGGYATFSNAHQKSIVFIGTYYQQCPALVFLDGSETSPKSDRETFFLGQTAKDVYFQGSFHRKDNMVGGSLMAIDSSGKEYKHTTHAYDKCVIGILSDNVGEVKDNQVKKEERIIATSGIIRLRVSAIGGKIGVGDLLTSSNTEGVAMKADVNNPKAIGTIIAKALEPYSTSEEGKIRVLIMQK